jgi:hypothetical protein
VHAGDRGDHALDLRRGDVLAADLEHVLGAVTKADRAIGLQVDPVAGAKPSVKNFRESSIGWICKTSTR